MTTTTKTRGGSTAKSVRIREKAQRLAKIVSDLDELSNDPDLADYKKELTISADELAGPVANLALAAILY